MIDQLVAGYVLSDNGPDKPHMIRRVGQFEPKATRQSSDNKTVSGTPKVHSVSSEFHANGRGRACEHRKSQWQQKAADNEVGWNVIRKDSKLLPLVIFKPKGAKARF